MGRRHGFPNAPKPLSSGTTNVVVFDSPVPLPGGPKYPVSRQSYEHLQRIESVVRFYKEAYDFPIWIMGHSKGTASITEFHNMLQKEGKSDWIQGAIDSSARKGSSFHQKTQWPLLFPAHECDGWGRSTSPRSLQPGFSSVQWGSRSGLPGHRYIHPCAVPLPPASSLGLAR